MPDDIPFPDARLQDRQFRRVKPAADGGQDREAGNQRLLPARLLLLDKGPPLFRAEIADPPVQVLQTEDGPAGAVGAGSG